MRFEFDPRQSESNHAKHGIDFIAAQALWRDDARVSRMARTEGEPRWLVTGRIEGRAWSAVVTIRPGTVRLISVRRARPSEEADYDDA